MAHCCTSLPSPFAVILFVASLSSPYAQLVPPRPTPQNFSRTLFNTTIYDDFSYFAEATEGAMNYLTSELAYSGGWLASDDVSPIVSSLLRDFRANVPSVRMCL